MSGGIVSIPPGAGLTPTFITQLRASLNRKSPLLLGSVLDGTTWRVRFLANTPWVQAHVQSTESGEGGMTYDPVNFRSSTQVDCRATEIQDITITGVASAESYAVFLIPVEYDAAGTKVLYNGQGGRADLMARFVIPSGPQGPQGVQGIQGPAGSDGSDGEPRVLGRAYVAGASGAGTDYSTFSATPADVDAANLAVTFTVPASGTVLIILDGHAYLLDTGGTPPYRQVWGVREGTTLVSAEAVALHGSPNEERVQLRLRVSGLTPDDVLTYKWAFRRGSASGVTVGIKAGGTNTDTQFGPAIMEVWSA